MSSLAPLNRTHHSTRRFNNNVNRSKISSHHSILSPNVTQSIDINNNNSNNPNTVFVHYEHGHADSLLEALNDLRLSRHLCDVTIVVDQHEYPCHKVRFHLTIRGHFDEVLFSLRMFLLLLVRTFVQCLRHPK